LCWIISQHQPGSDTDFEDVDGAIAGGFLGCAPMRIAQQAVIDGAQRA
jgi:hypothetical protein